MAVTISPFLLAIFSVFTFFLLSNGQSPEATTDFSCNSDLPRTCDTYLTYRALTPPYMHVKNISLLFGINPESIVQANKLKFLEEPLTLNQLILIPIPCSCNGSFYFFNASYEIQKSDSFYGVSVSHFQNLTKWLYVIDQNPNLVPTNLTIGSKAIFPLLCKCTSKTQSMEGVKNIVTYVWQPYDDIFTVGAMFDIPAVKIASENNYRNFTAAIALPVLIPVYHQPVIYQFSSPPSNRLKRNHNRTLVIIGVFILIVIASLLAYRHIIQKKKLGLIRNGSQMETFDLLQGKKKSKNEKSVSKSNHDKLLPDVSGYLGQPIMYERKKIMEATMNLNERYKIGGSVYNAIIDDQIIAVKKVYRETGELKLLQKVNHGNIVNLMGISSDFEGNSLLVFEFAENGSLNQWLRPLASSSGSVVYLTWTQRLNIALDVANGLQYMHEHTQPSIVHGDIRTSNILLSSRFKAKISNFSEAKHVTSSIMPKIDILGFGLVLLELLSGRKTMEMKENGMIDTLAKEIIEILEDGDEREERLRRWMDPKMEGYFPMDSALGLAILAKVCISEKYSERPSMSEIVFNLSVLTQSSPDYDKSFISGMENKELILINKPVLAR